MSLLEDLPSSNISRYSSDSSSSSSDDEEEVTDLFEEEEIPGCDAFDPYFFRRFREEKESCTSQVMSRFHHLYTSIRSSVSYPRLIRTLRTFRTRVSQIQGSHLTRRVMRAEMREARSKIDSALRDIYRMKRNLRHMESRHISFAMASSSISHVFCCAACRSTIFVKQHVSKIPYHAIVNLEDSRETFIVSQTEVGALSESKTFRYDRTASGTFRMRIVTCSHCGLFLGVKVKDFQPSDVDQDINENFRSRMNRSGILVRPVPELLGRTRRRRGSSLGNADFTMEVAVDTYQSDMNLYRRRRTRSDSDDVQGAISISTFFLGRNYILAKRARDLSDTIDRVPIRCQCDRILTYTDQLLCAERRWSFNAGEPPSAACYVNSVVQENVKLIGDAYVERLAQGPFEMADLACQCGTRVGYKFVRDCSDTKRNVHQQGRYGIVLSRVKLCS